VPSLVDPAIAAGQLSSSNQPTLKVGSILLRPWAEDDVSAVVAAYQEPEIQRWHARSMTLGEARQWISDAATAWSEETGASWAVAEDGVLAGRMTLKFHLADGCAGAGYWTRRASRGREVAPQALLVAARWAFDAGLHRVELEHSTLNPASCRVASKAGFDAEGTRRGGALHADGWHDMHVHGKLADSR
jgi:[ribosomal protein S5]-alanine N-acetyltransferase